MWVQGTFYLPLDPFCYDDSVQIYMFTVYKMMWYKHCSEILFIMHILDSFHSFLFRNVSNTILWQHLRKTMFFTTIRFLRWMIFTMMVSNKYENRVKHLLNNTIKSNVDNNVLMQMHFISTKYFFNYMWRKSYNLETKQFPLSENEKRSFSIKVYFVQMAIQNLPIISNETVRCSLPEAFIAPRTVPTTEQHIPTNAIMTMNHRMETVWKALKI